MTSKYKEVWTEKGRGKWQIQGNLILGRKKLGRHEHTEGEAGPEEEGTKKTGPQNLLISQISFSDHHGLYFPRVPTTMFHEVGFLKQRKFLLQFRRLKGQ